MARNRLPFSIGENRSNGRNEYSHRCVGCTSLGRGGQIATHACGSSPLRPSIWLSYDLAWYHVARASVLLRAQELAVRTKLTAQPNTTIPVSSTYLTIRERKCVAYEGRLVGRPDVIRTKEIVDYKTGGITEYDDSQKEVVKASYIRQLRIYGYLVRENLGWWPDRGMLVPMIGPGIETALTPADCEREAAQAVALLDAYNATIVSDENLIGLAQPSVRACKWCSYKAICPAFWERASPEWSPVLDEVAAEGVITDKQFIRGGAAVAITMEIERGTETRRSVHITPLNTAIHTYMTSLMKSEKIRVIRLRARPDGALAPTQRTIIFRTKDIPSLQRAVGSASGHSQL
jgi:hypothetical protein